MNGEEIKIVVESSKGGTNIKFNQVTGSGSKLVLPSIHHLSKNIFLESHPNGGHLSNCIASVDHVAAPSVHGFFKLGKIGGGLNGEAWFDCFAS